MKNKITMKKNQVTKNRGLLYLLFPFFCVLCLGISIKAQEKKDIKAIDVSDDPTLKVDDLKLEITKVDSKKTIDTIESKVVDTSKKAINNTNNVSNYDNEKGMNLEQKDTKKNENAQIEKIQNLENVDKKSNDIEIIIDSKKTDSKDKIEISANMILQDDLEIPIVKEKNSVDNKLKNDNIIQKDDLEIPIVKEKNSIRNQLKNEKATVYLNGEKKTGSAETVFENLEFDKKGINNINITILNKDEATKKYGADSAKEGVIEITTN